MRNTAVGLRWPLYFKENDKYQHLVTYSDETVIKHLYFNVDDEVFTFNQTLHNM